MLQPTFDHNAHPLPADSMYSTAPAAAANRTVDLREMVRILRRRRWIIACTIVTFVALAVAFTFFVTSRYTATFTILIDTRPSHVADNNDQPQPSNFGTDDAMVESQVLLIQSDAVLRRVVENLKLADDPEFGPHPSFLDPFLSLFNDAAVPTGQRRKEVAEAKTVERLQRRLKATRAGTTFVIDIDASSESPEKAAKIANAVADSYFYEQVQSKFNTNKIAASWLNRQLDELKSRVLASDKAVEAFRSSHNLITTQGQTVNDQQLTDLNTKLVQAHVQSAEARTTFDQVQKISSSHADLGTLDQALASDVIKQLRTQYAEVAKNFADLSSKFGPEHPLVVNAKAQLRATQRLINQETKRIVDNTRDAYQVAKSREEALKNSLDQLQSASSGLSEAQVRLRELQREADANRTLYEAYLARYKQTTAQESLELTDSRIVSPAKVPIRPSFPKTLLILALSIFLGMGLGTILAFVVDFLDRGVTSLRQAEEITRLPTLAAIPVVGTRELARRAYRGRRALLQYDPKTTTMLPAVMQPPLMRYALEVPRSLFAEAVRSVRLAVQRAARNDAVKLIMVSSSIDGEGKTTLAVNLALSFASVGMRTILVDGDLRNPEMTRSLCPQAKIGLVDVAASNVPLEQAILVDKTTKLVVLPSPSRENAAYVNEFVFSQAMRNLLGQLRSCYDIVVIDAPPLVPLVDARALGEQADRILLAIRWDATPQEVVALALESLGPAYGRVLGTVLTRVDLRRLRFYDYYRSSSYLEPYSYLGQPRAGSLP